MSKKHVVTAVIVAVNGFLLMYIMGSGSIKQSTYHSSKAASCPSACDANSDKKFDSEDTDLIAAKIFDGNGIDVNGDGKGDAGDISYCTIHCIGYDESGEENGDEQQSSEDPASNGNLVTQSPQPTQQEPTDTVNADIDNEYNGEITRIESPTETPQTDSAEEPTSTSNSVNGYNGQKSTTANQVEEGGNSADADNSSSSNSSNSGNSGNASETTNNSSTESTEST